MKYNRIFTGFEVEGPERGKFTLFIPKNAENRFDFLKVAKQKNIKRLYFGAGNDRGIHASLIPMLYDIPLDCKVYLEILSNKDLINLPTIFLHRTKVILVLKNKKGFEVLPSVIKFESNIFVNWFDLDVPITTFINDKLYEEDKLI